MFTSPVEPLRPKDLAKSLAISCVVTNCGDGLDFRAMGVIFSGLSETGHLPLLDSFVLVSSLRHVCIEFKFTNTCRVLGLLR